ncbi:MAG TPA: hypothetical protein PKG60_16900 [Spirochaetota bacterium]|nr:hypothetical protein [Spirochaetota bacterium]
MKLKPLSALIVTALLLSACSGLKLQNYPPETCTKLPGDKTVNVIKDRCSLCHKGDFAAKETICIRKSMIIDAVSAKRMPKFGKLSEEELNTILKWEL